MTWDQDELAAYRAIGDWEKLWEATVPLVKLQYGRMVRSGVVPEPAFKGDDEWLHAGILLAGEAMRTWEPEKGAYSTYIIATLTWGYRRVLEKSWRGGLTARHSIPLQMFSLEQVRDDLPDSHGELLDEGFADEGTYSAALTYEGVIGSHGVPAAHYPQRVAPEGLGDPVAEAARMETQVRLVAGLASLPESEREVLLATQTETQEAYAKRNGIALRTVRGRLSRARRNMAAFLASGG